MPAEMLDTPLPTPHPDEAAQRGKHPEQGPDPGVEPESTELPDSDEATYDSCLDDLNVMLAQPIADPDPLLQSRSSAEEGPRAPQKTSELFGPAGPLLPGAGTARGQPRGAFSSLVTSIFSGRKRARKPDSVRRSSSGRALATPPRAGESGTPDADTPADSPINWLLLLLLSYSSAVSLALGLLLVTGRTFRPADPPVTDTRDASVESTRSSSESLSSAGLPPVPPENQTTLGQPIRIGQLEITPLAITSAPVELVGMVEPFDYRREDTDSLILRLRVTNTSSDHAITPLDRALIRDLSSPLDRSLIVVSGGRPISLFPLAIDSEWLIQGQSFSVLQPGETAETLLASEAITDDRMAGEMSWRVRLRTGPYRTDVLAVRFTKDDVTP
jgi:hypothetical protein